MKSNYKNPKLYHWRRTVRKHAADQECLIPSA